MRLNEFTDPTDYTLTGTDAAKLLKHIERMWPDSIEDDDAPLLLRPKRRPQTDRAKLSDER